MNKTIVISLYFLLPLFVLNCHSEQVDKKLDSTATVSTQKNHRLNFLSDVKAISEDGAINAVIEIPAGTINKWALDKSSGEIRWEKINKKPRVINYIGYPGNYGMIPRTLLSKEKGGDGDPLDIIVLGPPVETARVLKCKIIGVLYLQDGGEQDDKLIAVSRDAPMYAVNSIDELKENYKGIAAIIHLWFINYKGPGKMESSGFGNQKAAIKILQTAMKDYQSNDTKRNSQSN